MISHDGTMPMIGRSLSYRCASLQILGQLSLINELPDIILPEQVRVAMTCAIQKSLSALNTFDADGWLQIGYTGHQPSIAENYISTGSLYLVLVAFLPLGLKPDTNFWIKIDHPSSSQLVNSGSDISILRGLNKKKMLISRLIFFITRLIIY